MGNFKSKLKDSQNTVNGPNLNIEHGISTLPSSLDQESKISVHPTLDEIYTLGNPGLPENIHKECNDVMPVFSEGARIVVAFLRCLSNHFQIAHTWDLLPNREASCYRFGATYVDGKGTSLEDSYPILFGEIEKSGNMQASILHRFHKKIRLKADVQYQGARLANSQFVTAYMGDSCTASFGLKNINFQKSSGIVFCKYLQSLTRNLVMGGEITCQYGPFMPSGYMSTLHLVSRYINGSSIISSTVGMRDLQLSYFKQSSEQLKIGVEITSNFETLETRAAIGYRIDLSNLVFQGMIDTKCNVCSVLEKQLTPLTKFTLSGLFNQKTNQFKLGYGFTVG